MFYLTRGRNSGFLDVRHPGFFLLRVGISCLRPNLPMKLDHTRVPSHDWFVSKGTIFGSCKPQRQDTACFGRQHQQDSLTEGTCQSRIPTLTPPTQLPSFMGRDRTRSPSDDDRRHERRRDQSRDKSDTYRKRSRSKDRDRGDGDRDRDGESSRRKHRSRSRVGERSHKR